MTGLMRNLKISDSIIRNRGKRMEKGKGEERRGERKIEDKKKDGILRTYRKFSHLLV